MGRGPGGERSSPLQAAEQGSPAALWQDGFPWGHWCPCTRGPPRTPSERVCVRGDAGMGGGMVVVGLPEWG